MGTEKKREAELNGCKPFGGAIGSAWIPCEQVLPRVNEIVLTHSPYGVVIGKFDENHQWRAEHCDYETGEPWLSNKGTVTHWMPLPSGPNTSMSCGGTPLAPCAVGQADP